MAKLSRTTTVHARVEDVFDFLDDKTHYPEFWPSMMDVSDIHDLPNGGKKFHWTYKMAGLRFEGDSEDVEVIPNKKLVGKNEKGIESTVTWSMDGHGDETAVLSASDSVHRCQAPHQRLALFVACQMIG
ncbi:MAG: SRPBCC domain-containing protein [Acidobacteriota bacterium]